MSEDAKNNTEELPSSGAQGMIVGAGTSAGEEIRAQAAPLDDDPESMLAYQSLMRHRKQRRRKKIIGAVIVAALALCGLGYLVLSRMGKSQIDDMPQVQSFPVMRTEFVDSVSAQGTLKPISSVIITPEVDGIIETRDLLCLKEISFLPSKMTT